MPNLIRDRAQKKQPGLYDSDSERFDRYEPEFRQRQSAFLDAARRPLERAEGGAPAMAQGGRLLSGAGLQNRTLGQAGLAGQLSSLVGRFEGQRMTEEDLARAKFMQERQAARFEYENALRQKDADVARLLGMVGYNQLNMGLGLARQPPPWRKGANVAAGTTEVF